MDQKVKSSNFLKRAFQIFIGCLLAIAVFIALLPTLVSTSFGQKQLVKIFNRYIPGSIELQEAHLSWFGNQEISGLTLNDPQGYKVITLQNLSTSTSLFNLARGHLNHAEAAFKGLNATLTEVEPGLTNLQKAVGTKKIQISSENNASHKPYTIALTDVNGKIDLQPNDNSVSINLQGNTQQEDLKGNFDIELGINGIYSKNGFVVDNNSDITLKVNVGNFPVTLIDHFLAITNPNISGIAQAALGKTLNLNTTKTIANKNITFDISLKASNLNAEFAGDIDSKNLILRPPGSAHIIVTPELIDILMRNQTAKLPIKLLKSFEAQLSFQELTFPIAEILSGEWDVFPDITTILSLNIDKAEFTIDGIKKPVTLNKAVANFNSPASQKKAVLKITGEAIQFDLPMQINVRVALEKPIQWDMLLDQMMHHSELDATLSDIPLDAVDTLLGLNGALLDQLGERASLDLHGTLSSARTNIKMDFETDKLFFNNATFEKHNNSFSVTTTLEADKTSQLSALLGEKTYISAKLATHKFEIDATNSQSSARIAGKFLKNTHIILTEPLMINYTLTTAASEVLGFQNNKILLLEKPTTVKLKILPFQEPLDLKNISLATFQRMTMAGELQIDELALAKIDPNPSVDAVLIRHLIAPWEINFEENHIQAQLSGTTKLGNNPEGSIQGDILIKHWLSNNTPDFTNASISSNLSIDRIPILLLSALTGKDELVQVLGNTLDIDLKANIQSLKGNDNTIDITLNGDNFNGKAGLKISEAITLKDARPITFELTLSPQRFAALRRLIQKTPSETNVPDSLALLNPMTIFATLQKLHVPINNLAHASFESNINIDSMNVANLQRNQSMALQDIIASIDTPHLHDKIQFNISAKENSKSHGQTDLIFKGSIENALTELGQLNSQNLSLNLEARSNRLPAGLFCQMACLDNSIQDKIEALLGHTIDTDVIVQLKRMNGPVQVKLQGKNGRVSADAQLTNSILTLNKPLEIEVAVTPELSKSILQDVIPILSGAIAGDKPIKITVDPQGFSIPLKNLQIENIQINKATIELGKILFSNQGELGSIFTLLSPTSNEKLTVWFTPLYLQLSNGTLKLSRMDMLLLNRFPTALWGSINFPKDRIDLIIGLSGTALGNALGDLNLEKDYMMQLPFKGSLGKASIDKAKATARISALVAQNQGSAPGTILGTVLEIAGGGLSEKAAPPPTTNPLPWANDKEVTANTDQHSSKKAKKKKKQNPIEQGANELLNTIFR